MSFFLPLHSPMESMSTGGKSNPRLGKKKGEEENNNNVLYITKR